MMPSRTLFRCPPLHLNCVSGLMNVFYVWSQGVCREPAQPQEKRTTRWIHRRGSCINLRKLIYTLAVSRTLCSGDLAYPRVEPHYGPVKIAECPGIILDRPAAEPSHVCWDRSALQGAASPIWEKWACGSWDLKPVVNSCSKSDKRLVSFNHNMSIIFPQYVHEISII